MSISSLKIIEAQFSNLKKFLDQKLETPRFFPTLSRLLNSPVPTRFDFIVFEKIAKIYNLNKF